MLSVGAALLVLVGLGAIFMRVNIPARALTQVGAAVPVAGQPSATHNLPCH